MTTMLRSLIVLIVTVFMAVHTPDTRADDSVAPGEARPLVGWVEFIRMGPDRLPVKAKLDTGARTSSMRATNMKYFKRNGKKWVRFDFDVAKTPPADGSPAVPATHITFEARINRFVRIKQHAVDYVRRPEVTIPVEMGGKIYDTEFTLTDRKAFKYPVLLGRRFLEKTVYVDAARMHMTGIPPELFKRK